MAITHVALDDSKRVIVAGILRPDAMQPELREIPNEPRQVRRLFERLLHEGPVRTCYEAGVSGYDLYRQLTALGVDCAVIAPALTPRKPVNWVVHPAAEAKRLLAEGKVDAYLGFPPDPQELRAKKIGHVVVNSALDRPWSGYFCCTVGANREFVRKHPVATKRGLRAILKAADICASEPEKVARLLVDKGYTKQYEYARQALREIPYTRWREYDPEDTVRFYSLRLHEAGMIKSNPQKIIAQGSSAQPTPVRRTPPRNVTRVISRFTTSSSRHDWTCLGRERHPTRPNRPQDADG